MTLIRPLLLVSDYNVKLELDDLSDNKEAPALVEKRGETSYTIIVRLREARSLYEQSWAATKGVTFDQYVTGLTLHEVAHIRYESFKPSPINKLMGFIDNVVEDSRIEYALTREFPSYAKYIQVVIYTIKCHYETNVLNAEQDEKLKNLMDTLYGVARFGTVTDGMNQEFVSFITPLLLSAMRGNRKNCFTAIEAIYEYVMADCEFDIQPTITLTYGPVHSDELSNTGESIRKGSTPEEIMQSFDGDGDGGGGDEILLNEPDTSFYRATISKRQQLITELHRVFHRIFQGTTVHASTDGDLNLMRQMNAYIASVTGDDGPDYLRLKEKEQTLDIMLLRDTSGSTSSFEIPYAEAILCIAAALDHLKGVTTTIVDFNYTARVVKSDATALNLCGLNPYSDGGTVLMEALEIVKTRQWTSPRRIVIIITDGGIQGLRQCFDLMGRLSAHQHVHFGMFNIIDREGAQYDLPDQRIVNCTLESLPRAVSQTILSHL